MQWEIGDSSVMSKEREYRTCAGACVDLANKANNEEDKKHLLAMAEAWGPKEILRFSRRKDPFI